MAVAEFCGNVELCRLTEQVVFSDPYKVSQYNRWTSPYLDNDATAVREDNALKLEVAELKSMYYTDFAICFILHVTIFLLSFYLGRVSIVFSVGSAKDLKP